MSTQAVVAAFEYLKKVLLDEAENRPDSEKIELETVEGILSAIQKTLPILCANCHKIMVVPGTMTCHSCTETCDETVRDHMESCKIHQQGGFCNVCS
jgi:hypothetical protein